MNPTEALWYPGDQETGLQRVLRSPLSAAAWGFRAAVAGRNALYDSGVLRTHRLEGVRVISVGNLNVGGAGKTPVVIHLASRLGAQGLAVAVLSRGYGRRAREPISFDAGSLPSPERSGDEPALIATRCPQVRVHVGADRVALAHRAREEGAKVLILDDGLQHRRLGRDLDIVVIDESVGFGNGALLPRGPLREPPSALKRANLVWLRTGDRVVPLPPISAPIVRARHRPAVLLDPDGQRRPLELLRGRRVHALSGIARPSSFTRTLESLGAVVTGTTAARDHHPWRTEELDRAAGEASRADAWIVTTEKDRVRLPHALRVHVVQLEVEITAGEDVLERLLGQLASPR